MHYLLSLGSNLGNRTENLSAARQEIAMHCGEIVRESGLYETAPWGFETDSWFYNQVVEVVSSRFPEDMMESILAIETSLGRDRKQEETYQSRSVDVDILLLDDQVIETSLVQIPHPRMHQRKFVLVPAVEIAADWVHPIIKKTLSELLQECADDEEVRSV